MRETADRHPEAERVELWFMDEARVGQKGRLTHVWYQKGVRPRGVRQQGFASAHLFGAVCSELSARTGAGPRWRSLRPRQRSRTKSSTRQNTATMRVSRSMTVPRFG